MAKQTPAIVLTGRDSYPDTRRRPYRYRTGGNQLIPTATQNTDRSRIPLLDRDVHRNVTCFGRRTLMSVGRHLFCANDIVRGTIEDMARLVSASFITEYRGADKGFKTAVENWTYNHDRVCDIAGGPYNARTYRKKLVRAALMDGDMGTVYVKGPDGRPYRQSIPAHRIGSDNTEEFVTASNVPEFVGRPIIDGVILGDYCNPIGYRVLTGEPGDYKNFTDVPADRMKLSFIPLFDGQLRGLSIVGLSAWNWQDRDESKRFELLAQKAGAGRMFQEFNEEGEPPPGADYATGPATGDTTAGHPTGLWFEEIDGGLNTYFRTSDPNARLEAVKFDRPSSNQREFSNGVAREGLYALGWSFDFYLDPTKLGGAPGRVVVDRVNDVVDDIRDEVVEPEARRFDGFRVPVAMLDLKEVPFASDWHQLEYQPRARITADRKYDSDVTVQEIRAGIKTKSKATTERGESEEDVAAQRTREVESLYARAEPIAKKYGRPITEVITLLESPTPNGMPAQKTEETEKPNEET